jgi:hypothetical protein
MQEWEIVIQQTDGLTARLKVNGGYLYRETTRRSQEINMCMEFVPDVDLTRYQSHLRDAYTQGFNDGMEEGIIKGVHRATGAE